MGVGTIPWMESIESSREQRPSGCRAFLAQLLDKPYSISYYMLLKGIIFLMVLIFY